MVAVRASRAGDLAMVLPLRPVRQAWAPPERARRARLSMAGALGVAVLPGRLLVAIFAPLLSPHSPTEQFGGYELAPLAALFPAGTDTLGRDILSRILFGTRVSLLVGVVAMALDAGLGGGGGLMAGYLGRGLDAVVMR